MRLALFFGLILAPLLLLGLAAQALGLQDVPLPKRIVTPANGVLDKSAIAVIGFAQQLDEIAYASFDVGDILVAAAHECAVARR